MKLVFSKEKPNQNTKMIQEKSERENSTLKWLFTKMIQSFEKTFQNTKMIAHFSVRGLYSPD